MIPRIIIIIMIIIIIIMIPGVQMCPGPSIIAGPSSTRCPCSGGQKSTLGTAPAPTTAMSQEMFLSDLGRRVLYGKNLTWDGRGQYQTKLEHVDLMVIECGFHGDIIRRGQCFCSCWMLKKNRVWRETRESK